MIKDASIFYDRNSEVTEGIFILFYFLFKNKTKKTKPETMWKNYYHNEPYLYQIQLSK